MYICYYAILLFLTSDTLSMPFDFRTRNVHLLLCHIALPYFWHPINVLWFQNQKCTFVIMPNCSSLLLTPYQCPLVSEPEMYICYYAKFLFPTSDTLLMPFDFRTRNVHLLLCQIPLPYFWHPINIIWFQNQKCTFVPMPCCPPLLTSDTLSILFGFRTRNVHLFLCHVALLSLLLTPCQYPLISKLDMYFCSYAMLSSSPYYWHPVKVLWFQN